MTSLKQCVSDLKHQKINEPDIRNKLEFAIWIDVTANPPVTEEENVARQYLRRLIYKNLKLKENREEKQSN